MSARIYEVGKTARGWRIQLVQDESGPIEKPVRVSDGIESRKQAKVAASLLAGRRGKVVLAKKQK